ncbi:MAG: hypothetical protein LAO78_17920 [Acidobacteriia bacterium]|nr:hypothetical protein [Terriglobia bacterium]
MKCEICKTIEKLGLDPATHDRWMCADSHSPRLVLRKAQIAVHRFCVKGSVFFQAKWQYAGHALHRRTQYVTLGL